MTKEIEYYPQGTCCRKMVITVEDDRVKQFQFVGGCHGNLQGIGALIKGMKCEEVIERLSGIRCGSKMTSCPDQLSRALSQYLEEQHQ